MKEERPCGYVFIIACVCLPLAIIFARAIRRRGMATLRAREQSFRKDMRRGQLELAQALAEGLTGKPRQQALADIEAAKSVNPNIKLVESV
jgi:hypothetical protein